MVGTRKVLREDDEVQPNGKVFKKWEMGEYEWKSYMQIDEMANNFGKGLRELGLNPMDRICIFAETKADWLVCALGCFKQTFPLVTLYANLGDDAIVHGVNETEVTKLLPGVLTSCGWKISENLTFFYWRDINVWNLLVHPVF